VHPKLKNAVWERSGADLYVMDDETQLVLVDHDGQVENLLELLRDGTRDPRMLTEGMAARWPQVTEAEITAALGVLDEHGLLLDAEETAGLSHFQRERYASNLAFFTTYASLDQAAPSLQRKLLDAHVVFLGTGGLGSTAIQALAGAGVGRMTLLDSDRVELRNFARQYLYRQDQIGCPKADCAAAWVRAFNSEIEVQALSRWIGGPSDIADLLTGADLVVSGVDVPAGDIDMWVNQACVGAGVPYVRGGVLPRSTAYWSVDPGRSPCMACHQHTSAERAAESEVRTELRADLDWVNRGIGPVASSVGAAVAMEALRYLTGFAEPIAAGCTRFTRCATGAEETVSWQYWPGCPVCATAPGGRTMLAAAARQDG
jgi:molybdopterin-synthase adenylyltransferase